MFVKILKNNVKKFAKCLEIKNKALPLHPQSGKQCFLDCSKGFEKYFEKKVTEKFGTFKISIYLCTRFPL